MQSISQSAPVDRLLLHRLDSQGGDDTFERDVRSGLTARPKRLPPKYFYDELGSYLFEAICCLPEYYLTRAENEILLTHADAIIADITGDPSCVVRLIELGGGSAVKTRHLISALLRRQPELLFLPIDISAVALERSSRELLHEYPRLKVVAYAADYFTALRGAAGSKITECGRDQRNLVLFLGSNIGNFDPDESCRFLREIRGTLHVGDALLLGADLKKSPSVLDPAYDDALGVTAAFNRNLLIRINRELGGDFDVSQFDHSARYDVESGRVETRLVSRTAQTVHIKAIDIDVGFEAGETIHTENSYKFDLDQLSEMARESGFRLRRSWFDSRRFFSCSLFAAIDAK